MDKKYPLDIFFGAMTVIWFQQVLKDVTAAVYEGPPASKTFTTAGHDANFIFEFLLGGVEVDQDNNIVLLDKEMASMRQGRAFLALINDSIPKSLISMEQMLATLEAQKKPLSPIQFQSVVLSSVYSAYQARNQEKALEQVAWVDMLVRLTNVTVNELRGHFLLSYT